MATLRSTSLLLLALCGACAIPVMPSNEDAETSAAEGSSTGVAGSASHTSGLPPADTGTTTELTTTGEGSTDEGMVFLFPPDGGGCFFAGEGELQPRCSMCDVGAQDCPDGEKCVPWANDGGELWNSNRCTDVPENPAGEGEPCEAAGVASGIDDCALGLMCFGVDPATLQGTCTALCNIDDPDACGDGALCADYDFFFAQVCLTRCDPTDPATCPAGESCRRIVDDLLCLPNVTLPEGLPCGLDEQHCAVEEACMPADELARCANLECCTPWCDLSAAEPDLPCGAVPGEVCRPYLETPPAGFEHVGVCGLPL